MLGLSDTFPCFNSLSVFAMFSFSVSLFYLALYLSRTALVRSFQVAASIMSSNLKSGLYDILLLLLTKSGMLFGFCTFSLCAQS